MLRGELGLYMELPLAEVVLGLRDTRSLIDTLGTGNLLLSLVLSRMSDSLVALTGG